MRSGGFLPYYRSEDGRRFLVRHAAWLVTAAFVLLTLFGGSDFDRIVTRRFFDAADGAFPWTNEWWLKAVLHDAARTASALGAVGLLLVTAVAWLVPKLSRAQVKHTLAFITAAVFAGAAAVVAAKHLSSHPCPWDIVDFGGLVPYRHLLEPHGVSPPFEGCFPAAHPVAGFGWLGVAFALYPAQPRLARLAALAALAVGTALGFVQVMRGAHFVSHVLWSAWTVWAIDVALLMLCRLGVPQRRCEESLAPAPLA